MSNNVSHHGRYQFPSLLGVAIAFVTFALYGGVAISAESQCLKAIIVTKNNSIILPATPSTGITSRDVTIIVEPRVTASGNCTTLPTLVMGSATVFLLNASNTIVGIGSKHLVPKLSGQPQDVMVRVQMVPGTPLGNFYIKHEVFARFSDGAIRPDEDGPFLLEETDPENKSEKK